MTLRAQTLHDPYLVGNGRKRALRMPSPEQLLIVRAAAARPEIRESFEAKCIPEPNSGCWLWLAATTTNGYGRLTSFKNFMLAHRLSYEIHIGPIPEGHIVCHRCDTPSCVNPDHLWIGTHQENTDDCISKGRLRPGKRVGEDNKTSRLKVREVLEIRAIPNPKDIGRLAARYKVGRSTIRRILSRETWRHV